MNLAALAASAVVSLGGGHGIPATHARSGDAVAEVDGTQAVLGDGQIRQSWDLSRTAGVTVAGVTDPVTGRGWALPGSPEFTLLLDSVSTSSTTGWALIGATAHPIPPDPARPDRGRGVEIVFRYGLALGRGLVELDRTWSLYPGDGIEQVSEQLVNRS